MAATDLCTLEEVKVYANLDTENAVGNVDTLLERLITSKTQAITKYIGFSQILAKDYTESYDGNGTSYLYPLNLPLISITSIHISSSWTFDATTLIDSDDYKIVNDKYITYKDYIFTLGDQNVQVIYNAGYAAIPFDLVQVCVEEVTRTYNDKANVGIVSRSDRSGGTTRIEKGFMKQSIEVMDQYVIGGLY